MATLTPITIWSQNLSNASALTINQIADGVEQCDWTYDKVNYGFHYVSAAISELQACFNGLDLDVDVDFCDLMNEDVRSISQFSNAVDLDAIPFNFSQTLRTVGAAPGAQGGYDCAVVQDRYIVESGGTAAGDFVSGSNGNAPTTSVKPQYFQSGGYFYYKTGIPATPRQYGDVGALSVNNPRDLQVVLVDQMTVTGSSSLDWWWSFQDIELVNLTYFDDPDPTYYIRFRLTGTFSSVTGQRNGAGVPDFNYQIWRHV